MSEFIADSRIIRYFYARVANCWIADKQDSMARFNCRPNPNAGVGNVSCKFLMYVSVSQTTAVKSADPISGLLSDLFPIQVNTLTFYIFRSDWLFVSLLGVLISPFFFSFHLFDIAAQSTSLQYVLSSVTKNKNMLLLTVQPYIIELYASIYQCIYCHSWMCG